MATMSLLDSSTLVAASCSAFRPTPLKNGATSIRVPGRVVRCSCSRQDESSSTTRRNALSTLVATGLALSISASSGIALAAEPSLINVSNNVAKEADKLLKDADKLINEDSPTRFGPSRGLTDEGSDRLSQQAGSGAIPELQSKGSELVGQARDSIADKAETTKQRIGESIQGKGDEAKQGVEGLQGKGEEAKKGVEGLFGQTQSKGEEAKKGVEGLFGQTQSKAEEAKKGVEGLLGQTQNKGEEAKKGVEGLFGQTQSKIGNNLNTVKKGNEPPGSLGDAGRRNVNTAKSKVESGIDTAKDNSEGLIGSIKKGLNIR